MKRAPSAWTGCVATSKTAELRGLGHPRHKLLSDSNLATTYSSALVLVTHHDMLGNSL
jgi:hypothetical protein